MKSIRPKIINLLPSRILEHFRTTPDEYSVIFTSGATAALKTVAETFIFSRGTFAYAQENHTSVLGMRELVKNRAEISCLAKADLERIFADRENATRPGKTLNKIPPDARKNSPETNGHGSETTEMKEVSSEITRIPLEISGNSLEFNQTRNSLFVYSAQCNFSGLKNPLWWIDSVQNGALGGEDKWHVLLDGAAFAATNVLDLGLHKPDFVAISFYKMFGYPTGLGALLVRNASAGVLGKSYYGGGTVKMALSSGVAHMKKDVLHERWACKNTWKCFYTFLKIF